MGNRSQPLLHDLAIAVRAPTVVLADRDGQIRPTGVQGVLHGDQRVLSAAVLTVDGAEPVPIRGGEVGAAGGEFVAILPEYIGFGDAVTDPTVWVVRTRTASETGMAERIDLVNHANADVRVELAVTVAADLAPIDRIRAGEAGTPIAPSSAHGTGVEFTGEHTGVRIDAPGAAVRVTGTETVLRWTITAPPATTVSCEWTVAVREDDPVAVAGTVPLLPSPRVRADDPRLAELVSRSVADLNALLMAEPGHEGDVFAGAGAPWYLTLFGRDSIWAARMLLPISVELAAGTLRTLARSQGREHDPAHRRSTGQDPARTPSRGLPPARHVPARLVLRHGRRDRVVGLPAARRVALGAGRGPGARTAAQPAGRAGLDHRHCPTRTATDSRSTSTSPGTAWPTRAGRTPRRGALRATAARPRHRSRWPRSRATSTRRLVRAPTLLDALGEPADRLARVGRRAAPPGSATGSGTDGGRYPALALDGAKRQWTP